MYFFLVLDNIFITYFFIDYFTLPTYYVFFIYLLYQEYDSNIAIIIMNIANIFLNIFTSIFVAIYAPN